MITVELSIEFRDWLAELTDRKASAIIVKRIRQIEASSLGDTKRIGDGLFEVRIHYGPGYRLYAMNRGRQWILLLCGSSKSDQSRAIKQAKQLAKEAHDA
ncbi:MAG: type II toxin-antitoxin system RelE/ParE family toxin [Rickettsiales bacterium]|jgi:putative addiction module killer protein|nr:type II toxin-antitoxin system RelE/ParE family toxin [Rickettsiales bacterium]